MARATTTKELFNNGEYGIFELDNGGVRIGMIGDYFTDIPHKHELYPKVLKLAEDKNPEEIEQFSDTLYLTNIFKK